MKNNFWILLTFSLFGCAHHETAPKTVHFPYAGELLKSIQYNSTSRAPASIALDVEEKKSTRRVYFSSLYHQYMTLGSHLKQTNQIESCPQFHHDKVEADSFNIPKISLVGNPEIEDQGREFFPELAFDHKFSLNDYHAVIKEEIKTLCEVGASDNFYKFDNLVTHYAHRTAFHRKPKAMESVLKIPIFANFYLIKMIQNKTEMNFTHPEEKQFISMTNTHWFDRYVMEASARRTTFIRNKMVKR